jgi:hypothetical protein
MDELVQFLFKGQTPRIVRIGLIKADTEKRKSITQEEHLRFQLVRFFSWILAFALLVCLVGVFVLLLTGASIPAFVPPIITGIIGYYGGAITAYFGIRSA